MRRPNAWVCALLAAACVLSSASVTYAFQPSESASRAASGLSDADLFELYEVYSGLGAGLDVRQFTRRGIELLERHGNTPGVSLDEINDLAAIVRYEPNGQKRREVQQQLADQLQELREELWRMCPAVTAIDVPNDAGKQGLVLWRMRPDAAAYIVERRTLKRGTTEGGKFEPIKKLPAGVSSYLDGDLIPRTEYVYRVVAQDAKESTQVLGESPIVRATQAWFNDTRAYFLAFIVVICGTVLVFIYLAQRGVKFKVREIAGLKAMDDAIGRATEMGRPVLFVPGIQDMDQIGTVAGLNILAHVAQSTAEYGATLDVPTSKSLVMVAARESVRAGYVIAGRPDDYDEKRIRYVTNEQMGYVSALLGTMVREKPAACIYMGTFYAESLLLAEVGNSIGSIQIAGTDETSQLPFFVAACDFTLLGEEFFAASAYLSGEPRQLGSLKGQDFGKLIVMILICAGVMLATLQVVFQSEFTVLGDWLYFMMNRLLKSGD